MFLAQVIEREEVDTLGKTKDEENVQRIYSLTLTKFLLSSTLKNSKRCSQMCDSNNGVLSKLVLSDTARSLDVICAGNDEKKSLGEMKGMKNNNTKFFSKERSGLKKAGI